ERVSSVRQHASDSGWHFPGRVPWGYQQRPASDAERRMAAPKSVLDLDPEAAPFVREAWRRDRDGEPLRKVGNWVAALRASAGGGGHLAYHSVWRMFVSPTYVARPRSGVSDVLQRPVGRWPALVDDDTWRQVQERIASHAHMPHQASGPYLLTGLLRCPL